MLRFPRARFSLTVAACLGSLSVTHADYIVVDDDGGPGVDHTTLLAAVQAASDGDRILVMDGDYDEQVTVSAGVAIIGIGSPMPHVDSIEWVGLPAFKQASLSNVAVDWVRVEQCAGTVSILDCGDGELGTPGARPLLSVDVIGSRDVRLRGCSVLGMSDEPSPSYDSVYVEDSFVELTACRVRSWGNSDGVGDGVGVRGDSLLGLHRSSVRGDVGYGGFSTWASTAVRVSDPESTAMITGRPEDLLEGIDAHWSGSWFGGSYLSSSAISNSGTTRVSGVTVVGGAAHDGLPASPPIQTWDSGVLIEPVPSDASLGIEFDTTYDASGATSVVGTMTLRVNGPVGEPVELLIGRRPSVTEVLPDGYPRLTQPHRTVLLGVVPPSGELVHSVTLPSNVRIGDRFVLQAAVGSGVAARYTNSAPVVLR